ncbi:MAG: hypothetical protein AAF215_11030 [Cyanobacteria bacterium P01_A01_bin.123]
MQKGESSQSFSISGSHVSNVQVGGQAGGNQEIIQNQRVSQGSMEVGLTQANVVEIISKIDTLIRCSKMSEVQKAEALSYLKATKEDAQEQDPDKQSVAKGLRRTKNFLKDTNDTFESGAVLFQNVQQLIKKLLPWLGVSVSFFV